VYIDHLISFLSIWTCSRGKVV